VILDRAGTIALARKLTALRPKSRLRRAPKPIPPTAIELSYYRAIEPICDRARAAFAEVEQEILKDLSAQRRTNGMDAAPPDRKRWFPHQLPGPTEWKNRSVALDARRALHLAAVAQNTFDDAFDWEALKELPTKFGHRIDVHQREQLDRQLRAATGLQYGSIEKPIRDHVAAWTTENVAFIKTVPERYFDRLRGDIEDAYSSGMATDTLAKKMATRYGSSQSDAKRIAGTSVAQLNGKLNEARISALGIDGYFWRGVQDPRERQCHLDLEGVRCTWDDPPMGGGTNEDETGHPGSGIGPCRCYPDPDFSPLLA
jgi:SPP1 gp7 family putative phage head morphogenesis protein